MEEKLISYETAKLAKEKAFDWKCRFLYKFEQLGWEEGLGVDYNWNCFDSYSCPTQSLLQKWLREVHKIIIVVDFEVQVRKYYYKIYSGISILEALYYNTYEECLEEALQSSLNKIK